MVTAQLYYKSLFITSPGPGPRRRRDGDRTGQLTRPAGPTPFWRRYCYRLLMVYLEQRERHHAGYFGTMPRRTHHEGSSWTLLREDGSIDEASAYQEISSELLVEFTEVPTLTLEEILQKLDKLAEELGRQWGVATIQKIIKETEASGQVVNSEGRGFTQEAFLEMMNRLEISFDENDEPELPVMVMNSNTARKVREQSQGWEQDEEFQKRYHQLIEKKREAWYDRENNRKLVD